MRALRLSMAAMVAMALIPLAAASASAAPPANDEVAGAVALSLGDRVVQDTTEATTNAGDDALNDAVRCARDECHGLVQVHPSCGPPLRAG